MSKHTPGPWVARRVEKPQHPFEGGYEINLPGFMGLTPVALLPEVRSAANFKEQEANARLIAAAPEMLEALKIARGAVERFATEEARSNKAPTGLPPSTKWRDKLAAIDAAIAKAEAA